MRSYRQHCGIENHLIGVWSAPPRPAIIRASDGVISGRSASFRPLLSSNEYSCCDTCSPAFLVYNCSCSTTGASYSSKPNFSAVSLQVLNNHFLRRMSSGYKSSTEERRGGKE